MTTLLEAVDVGCERGDRALFAGVALRVQRGEVHELRGPNGVGKTTLLRCLCGLGEPDAGSVQLHGEAAQCAAPFHYLGHSGGIKLELNARENLLAAAALHGGAPLRQAEAALQAVGLDYIGDQPARSLSAGQRRRVALARLTLCHAPLWILDEPLTSLDEAGIGIVSQLIAAHAAAGGAVIASTHQPLALRGVTSRLLTLAPPADDAP